VKFSEKKYLPRF